MRKSLLRAAALLTAGALLMLTACRPDNTDREPTAVITLKCMSWNDDFREAMETYFIPRHQELMENVEIQWISDEIVGYRENVEQRLDNGEVIDLFVGDDQMCPFFSGNSHVAALSQLGLTENDLSSQYPYTRLLGSDANATQRGAAMYAEPGVIFYRADYAREYLGVTEPYEMQQILSSWDTFLTAAKTISERSDGSVRMLCDSSEIWRSVEAEMMGHWLTDGQLSVSDETLTHWLTYVDELNAAKGLSGIKPFDDDWSTAVNGGVFCFFAAPWLAKSTASDNADIATLFSTAKRGGSAFGAFRTASAPKGFVYGGSWLYSSANSSHKKLVGEIIRAFTCDSEFMRLLALGNMAFVNHTGVIDMLSQQNIANPLFDGSDAFSVYHAAAGQMSLSAPSVYDHELSELLYQQARSYAQGKVNMENAIYLFKNNVWKKHGEITVEPQKPKKQAAATPS